MKKTQSVSVFSDAPWAILKVYYSFIVVVVVGGGGGGGVCEEEKIYVLMLVKLTMLLG